MTDLITKLLDDVQRLDERATQGPWTWGDNRDGLGNKLHPTAFPGKYNPIADFEYTNDEDAEFIALSRTALPKLAEALRAVIDEVRDLHLLASQKEVEGNPKAAYAYWVSGNRVHQALTDVLEGE